MLSENEKVPAGLKGILVTPGDVATNSGKPVTLASLSKDKILILYFYPKDNTPGCTTEAIAFRDHLKEFEKLNALVVGVSRDPVKSHCSFIKKQQLNFALLSDESGEICEAFGVWVEKSMYGKKYMGVARSTFIIKKNKIIKVYDKVDVKTHAAEILDFLKAH